MNKSVLLGSAGCISNTDIVAVYCSVRPIRVVKLYDVNDLVKDFDDNDAVHQCLYDASRGILFCLVYKCDIDGAEMNYGVLVLGMNYSSFNPLQNLTVKVGGQMTYPVWNQLGE